VPDVGRSPPRLVPLRALALPLRWLGIPMPVAVVPRVAPKPPRGVLRWPALCARVPPRLGDTQLLLRSRALPPWRRWSLCNKSCRAGVPPCPPPLLAPSWPKPVGASCKWRVGSERWAGDDLLKKFLRLVQFVCLDGRLQRIPNRRVQLAQQVPQEVHPNPHARCRAPDTSFF